ncbi:MAG: class I SAM-dependent methyltransferase [Desulfomonile sp.]|nr:class I SAM-dependent methyltransferase [Desulfomonile sp.]
MKTQPIVTEYRTCDLCGSDDHTLLYSRLDPVTREEYNLVECSSCGMAFVNPMPVAASIPSLYPADYLKDKPHTPWLYERMMRFLPRKTGGRLLDIGCGGGEFVTYAQQYGWNAEGVDLLRWNASEGATIRVGDFLTMDFQEDAYDAVTAWALLEHVRQPSLFFEKVSLLLKKDGRFVFVVPNVAAPGMKRSCTEDIPRHLHLFTPAVVRTYLRRYGMQPLAMYHNAQLYSSYPFGLVRYALSGARNKTRCSSYENRSVALLRNRQIKGNAVEWLAEVLRTVPPTEIILDAIDLAAGVVIANVSKLVRNYGVITVVAACRQVKYETAK